MLNQLKDIRDRYNTDNLQPTLSRQFATTQKNEGKSTLTRMKAIRLQMLKAQETEEAALAECQRILAEVKADREKRNQAK